MSQPLRVSLKPLKRVRGHGVLDETSVRLLIDLNQEERGAVPAEGSARWQPLLADFSEVPGRSVSLLLPWRCRFRGRGAAALQARRAAT